MGAPESSFWVTSSNIRPLVPSANFVISATMGLIPSYGLAHGHMTGHRCPSKREKVPLTPPIVSAVPFRLLTRISLNTRLLGSAAQTDGPFLQADILAANTCPAAFDLVAAVTSKSTTFHLQHFQIDPLSGET
jgi:hypothetical protein